MQSNSELISKRKTALKPFYSFCNLKYFFVTTFLPYVIVKSVCQYTANITSILTGQQANHGSQKQPQFPKLLVVLGGLLSRAGTRREPSRIGIGTGLCGSVVVLYNDPRCDVYRKSSGLPHNKQTSDSHSKRGRLNSTDVH